MTTIRRRLVLMLLLVAAVGPVPVVRAQDSPQASGAVTLFENVRIFDGKSASALRALQRSGARQQD